MALPILENDNARFSVSTLAVMVTQAFVAITAIVLTPSQGYAESPEHYCQYYAKHAVHLGEVARSVSSCRHWIEETPQRWSLNYDQHFAYCIRIYGSGHGMSEDAVRTRQIHFCAGS